MIYFWIIADYSCWPGCSLSLLPTGCSCSERSQSGCSIIYYSSSLSSFFLVKNRRGAGGGGIILTYLSLNVKHVFHRRHDRRLSLTLTGCPPKAAALERVDPARRSVLFPSMRSHPHSVNHISSPCLFSILKKKNPLSQQQCTYVVWDYEGAACHRSSAIWLRAPVVTNERITVFTRSVCCSRCLELYLALSLCVVTKLAEPAAA